MNTKEGTCATKDISLRTIHVRVDPQDDYYCAVYPPSITKVDPIT